MNWRLLAPLVRNERGIRTTGLFIVTFGRRAMTAEKWRALEGIRWADRSG